MMTTATGFRVIDVFLNGFCIHSNNSDNNICRGSAKRMSIQSSYCIRHVRLFAYIAAKIVVKSVRPLFAVCSLVCCFEKCFKCGMWVQHATRMLHYSASRHFFVMRSTISCFNWTFPAMDPTQKAKNLVRKWNGNYEYL